MHNLDTGLPGSLSILVKPELNTIDMTEEGTGILEEDRDC
jgi:hypothetical protein